MENFDCRFTVFESSVLRKNNEPTISKPMKHNTVNASRFCCKKMTSLFKETPPYRFRNCS